MELLGDQKALVNPQRTTADIWWKHNPNPAAAEAEERRGRRRGQRRGRRRGAEGRGEDGGEERLEEKTEKTRAEKMKKKKRSG